MLRSQFVKEVISSSHTIWVPISVVQVAAKYWSDTLDSLQAYVESTGGGSMMTKGILYSTAELNALQRELQTQM